MLFTTIIRDYIRWHYGAAFHELFQVWTNFLWFCIHFFSLPQLSRSLFSPWKRITEEKRGFSFENLAAYLVVNAMSRFIGVIIRGSVILVGLIALSITIVLGLIIYLLWFIAPVIMVTLLAFGVSLIITNTLI